MNESSFLGPVPMIVLHMSNVKHGAFREKWFLQINQIMPDEIESAWQKEYGLLHARPQTHAFIKRVKTEIHGTIACGMVVW